MIGVPTAERVPVSRAVTPSGPEASAKLSIRAGRPVSRTIVARFLPPRVSWLPSGMGATAFPQEAT
jgi:hypothetical protein